MSDLGHMALADVSKLARVVDDLWRGGELAVIDELYDDQYVGHDPSRATPVCGRRELRAQVGAFRTAFPDLRLELADIVVGGDRIAYRCVLRATHAGPLGELLPTGRSVTLTALEIIRFGPNGRICEGWTWWDSPGMLWQLRGS
jgi:predicted ester cyclase